VQGAVGFTQSFISLWKEEEALVRIVNIIIPPPCNPNLLAKTLASKLEV
jgi:hypothetical protein